MTKKEKISILSGLIVVCIFMSIFTQFSHASPRPIINLVLTEGETSVNTTNFKNDLFSNLQNKGIDTSGISISAMDLKTTVADTAGASTIFSSWKNFTIAGTPSATDRDYYVSGNRLIRSNSSNSRPAQGFYENTSNAFNVKDAVYDFTWGIDANNYGSFSHGEAGFLFRMQNESNYYAYLVDNHRECGNIALNNGEALVKVTNNSFRILAKSSFPSFHSGQAEKIKIVTEGSNIKVYRNGSLRLEVDDSSYSKGSQGFYVWDQYGAYFSDITMTTKGVKPFSQAIYSSEFNNDSTHLIIDVNNIQENVLNDSTSFNDILSMTKAKNIHFLGWGTSENQSQFTNFIANNDNKGMFVYNSDYWNSIEQTANYIISLTDRIPPTVSANPSSSNWVKDSVNVSATFSDNSAFSSYRYVVDQSSKYPSSGWSDSIYSTNVNLNISNNGNNYIHLEGVDRANNYVQQTFGPYRIDKILPTINTIYDTPSGWTNKDVIVTVTADDYESGIKNITLPDGQVVAGTSTTYAITGNGSYTFYTNDNAENTTSKTVVFDDSGNGSGIKIDKTAPTVTATYSKPTGWTNEDVVINVSATDGQSGVANITLPNGQIVNGSNVNYTVSENGSYTFKVTDNVGNIATKTVVFDDSGNGSGIKIDKTAPIINASYSAPTGWTNKNVVINVNATDGQSGVKNIILPDGSIVNGSSAKYEVSKNGVYIFKSTDNVGNISTKKVVIGPSSEDGSSGVKIDKTAPTLIVTKSTEEPTNKDVTINVIAKDSESGNVQIKLDSGTWIKADTTSFTITKNGTYTVYAKDEVGNITQKTIAIDNISKTKPNKPTIGDGTGEYWNNGGINPGKWYDDDVLIKIPQDLIDQMNKDGSHMEYQVKDKNTGKVIQVWENFTPGVTKIDVEGDLKIEFVIVDKYGNISDPTSIYLKLDKGNPILKLIPSTVVLTNGSVSINVKASDAISNIEKIILPNGSIVTTSETNYTVSKNGIYEFTAIDSAGHQTKRSYLVRNIGRTPLITNNPNVLMQLKSDDYLSGTTNMRFKNETNIWTPYEKYSTSKNWTLEGDGLKHIWVQYKDAAGNESQPIEDTIILDTTASTLNKFTINNGEYYTNDRVVNVQVNATDSLSGVDKLLVSNDNVNWTTINYSENFKWTIPAGDGEKTVYIKVQDVAGNISKVYSQKVYLDQTKPTASIIINNGDTYSASRDVKLTFNFQDGQSGIKTVRIIEGDRVYEFPTVPNSPTTIDWTLDYGVNKTVSIQVIDKAGNVSDLASDSIIVDKLKIEDFTLTDVINPIIFNGSNPFKSITWNFKPQHMLAGANISFDLRVKVPVEESVVTEKASYKVEIIDDVTGYHEVVMNDFTDVKDHLYSGTITLPKDAPEGAKVYISCEAIRKLKVSPYDTQYDYFPGTDKATKAQIGVIDKNIQELVKFNEMR